MTRKIFITIMVLFTAFNVVFTTYKVNQTNDLTDKYLEELMKNSMVIGCVFPTGDFNYCRELVNALEWEKLGPDLRKATENENEI